MMQWLYRLFCIGIGLGYPPSPPPPCSTYITLRANLHTGNRTLLPMRIVCRIQRDTKLWFSITAPLGIELLRGLITKQGITYLNRIQKTYTHYDYPTLRTQFHFPSSYPLLQAILLGEIHYPDSTLPQPAPPHPKRRSPLYLMLRIIQIIKDNVLPPKKPPTDPHAYLPTHCIKQPLPPGQLTQYICQHIHKLIQLVWVDTQSTYTLQYSYKKPYPQGLLFQQVRLSFHLRTAIPWQGSITLTNVQANETQQPLPFPFVIPPHYAKQ